MLRRKRMHKAARLEAALVLPTADKSPSKHLISEEDLWLIDTSAKELSELKIRD